MKITDIRFGKIDRRKCIKAGLFSAFILFIFVSCGIDDEPYLEPIDASTVVVTSNTGARVTIAVESGEGDYSPNFLLYYKIYISGASESGTISSAEDRSRINATLSSDYNGINTYTTLNTTNRPVFSPTVFSNRNFYAMIVNSIETFSGSGTITLNFENPSNSALLPSLTRGGETHTLYRSTGSGSFVPLPEDNRRFWNFTELRNTQNKDVAQRDGGGDYSYCAVYIIKRGVNPNTLSAIYSAPTFIAVFRLPERY
ncbi:MAG: hypothetical protein LBK61_05580 [Spirochaetaceae bacterium]|jgi:hypothetical protein|nr:hypothetical protein [Spirochaetaceae bacterium]